MSELFILEYSTINQVPLKDARQFMMSLFRSFYETACSHSTENSKKLKALTSLHILSPEGLNLNVSLLPRQGIGLNMAVDTVCLKAELMENSLRGRLHMPSVDSVSCKPGLSGYLSVTLPSGSVTRAVLQNRGISYELETNITVIGTTLEDEYICIIDNGKWRIR